MKTPTKPRLVNWPELQATYGEPRTRWTIQRLIKKGPFPAAKQLSANRVAWETAELDRYYGSRERHSLAKAG